MATLLIVVGVIGCLLTFHQTNKTHAVAETKMITENRYTSVEFQTDNATVEVVPTTGSKAKIELTGKETEANNYQLTTEIKGSTLMIHLKSKWHFQLINISDIFTKLNLKVSLPKKQYNALHINNNNGRVHLENMEAKDLKASTDNGVIELNNIQSKQVNVSSSNGKIIMANVEGAIEGKTDNGKISLKTHDIDRPITLDSDNGHIDIITEKKPTNVRFDVHVDNGHINLLNLYKDDAVVGKGKNLIKLSTDNGSITISKAKGQ